MSLCESIEVVTIFNNLFLILSTMVGVSAIREDTSFITYRLVPCCDIYFWEPF